MGYTKQNFVSKQRLSAAELNHIEDGLIALTEYVDDQLSNLEIGSTSTATNTCNNIQIKCVQTNNTYARLLKRGEALYLFLDNCFMISNDNGSTFSEKVKMFSETSADELALEPVVTNLTSVANATPYLLKDNRIAVYYRCNNDSTDNRYASIRLRYINEDNTVSAPILLISSTTNYGIIEDPTVGGLYEPAVHNNILLVLQKELAAELRK